MAKKFQWHLLVFLTCISCTPFFSAAPGSISGSNSPLTPAPTGSTLEKDKLTPPPTGTTTGRIRLAFSEFDLAQDPQFSIQSNEIMVLNLEHPEHPENNLPDSGPMGQDVFRYQISKESQYEFCFDAELTGQQLELISETDVSVLSFTAGSTETQQKCQTVTLKSGFYDCLISHNGQGDPLQTQSLFIRESQAEQGDKRIFISQDCPDCQLSQVNLKAHNFSNSNLIGADFSQADLSQSNFQGADLRRAKFTEARLSEATWTEGQQCTSDSVGRCILP